MSGLNLNIAETPPSDHGKNRAAPEHITCEPIYIRKLYDFLGGMDKVSKEIGVSQSLISQSLQNNETRIVNERAAELIWTKRYAVRDGKPENRMALVTAPESILEEIRDFLKWKRLPDGLFMIPEASDGR